MDFRARLTALRRAAGQVEVDRPADPEPSLELPADSTAGGPLERPGLEVLRERIARMQARPAPEPPAPRDDSALAKAVGGEVEHPGLIVARAVLPLDAAHGRVRYSGLRVAPLERLDIATGTPSEEIVYLDTETSGLAGGTGTIPFLTGIARVRSDVVEVSQFFLTRFEGEPAMLEALARELADARYLVTFNGKSFDAPLLSTRYALARRPSPLSRPVHVDLLHPTRRAFGRYWNDCRLQTAERELFGMIREDDIDGADIPGVWFDYMRTGRVGRAADVVSHNRLDILSLAALLPILAEALETPGRHGSDILSLARGFERHGDKPRCLAALESRRDHLDDEGLLELARQKRRSREWDDAGGIWRDLAARGDLRATEALAKYLEHVTRDLDGAIACTETLLRAEPVSERHLRRAARLRRKRSR